MCLCLSMSVPTYVPASASASVVSGAFLHVCVHVCACVCACGGSRSIAEDPSSIWQVGVPGLQGMGS